MSDTREIAFLFIGGAHQVYHLAPVAAALSRRLPDTCITCVYPDAETGAALARVRTALDAPALKLDHVPPPPVADWLARATRRHTARKGPMLMRLAPRLRRARAVITPERTSANLRWMGLSKTPMIHFRHGAGDRAPSSEARLKAFDLVVVAGRKDVERAVEVQHLDPAKVRDCGYVKLDFLTHTHPEVAPLFDNGRPVVVYNPHFDSAISSWPVARDVIERFRAQDRYNLVVAPHIRLSDDMTPEDMAEWQALAEPGRIIVDLRSPKLIDMTYLLAADVYLGDMSSQLYEFLARPRPVAFVNAHGAAWRGDPRYAGWRLGSVADSVEDVIGAVDRARSGHPAMIARQRAAVTEAFGLIDGAAERGAEIIAQTLYAKAA
ncbi:hypothetical protein [Glacieibacterium sp.]|uniref:hypothetical protein n=1 Tax=Glacieibacterium sp. TaxID=2860237 RepID=UPI003B007318